MDLVICINMDNSAFEDAQGDEVARILRKLASRYSGKAIPEDHVASLYDINGNSIGEARVEN